MGVVYEALDRERGHRVALKTLRRVVGGADALLRLKNEFRKVEDIRHPNLVSVSELFEHEGHWFFTMELVEGGVSFLQHVRPIDGGRVSDVPPAPTMSGVHSDVTQPLDAIVPPSTARTQHAGPSSEIAFDEAKLRASLAEIAHGLGALHAARMVHRDIKPSNVLVANGHVTILDFGLITEIAQLDTPFDYELLGTFSFMAPEQVVSSAVGPEADWYAVGVMLYLALTGRFPVPGRPSEMLTLKQVTEPIPPRRHVPGVPADLDKLCSALLAIAPDRRASGRDVLAGLDGDTGGASAGAVP